MRASSWVRAAKRLKYLFGMKTIASSRNGCIGKICILMTRRAPPAESSWDEAEPDFRNPIERRSGRR